MWYISTSFAFGTEEDREVDTTFKVLLLNIASEKHISKPHGIIQAEVVVGTFYKRCKLYVYCLLSLLLYAPIVNYAICGEGHGTT